MSQFFPLCSSPPVLHPHSHSQLPHCCPCPWVIHTHSLSSPFPFFLPLSPSSSSVFTFSLFHIFMSVVLFHVVPFLFLFLFSFWSFLFSALYLFFLSTFSSQKEAWLSSDWSLFVLYIIEFLPYPEIDDSWLFQELTRDFLIISIISNIMDSLLLKIIGADSLKRIFLLKKMTNLQLRYIELISPNTVGFTIYLSN